MKMIWKHSPETARQLKEDLEVYGISAFEIEWDETKRIDPDELELNAQEGRWYRRTDAGLVPFWPAEVAGSEYDTATRRVLDWLNPKVEA